VALREHGTVNVAEDRDAFTTLSTRRRRVVNGRGGACLLDSPGAGAYSFAGPLL